MSTAIHLVNDLTRLQCDRFTGGVVAQCKIRQVLVQAHADHDATHVIVGERRAVACSRSRFLHQLAHSRIPRNVFQAHRVDQDRAECPW